jgi:hypothetical protein
MTTPQFKLISNVTLAISAFTVQHSHTTPIFQQIKASNYIRSEQSVKETLYGQYAPRVVRRLLGDFKLRITYATICHAVFKSHMQ